MFSYLNENVECSSYKEDIQKIHTAAMSRNTFEIEEHFYDNIG